MEDFLEKGFEKTNPICSGYSRRSLMGIIKYI